MISFGDDCTTMIDMLQNIPPDYNVQIVKVGQTFDKGSDFGPQDYSLRHVQADGLIVLRCINANGEPVGSDITIPLTEVEQVHIY